MPKCSGHNLTCRAFISGFGRHPFLTFVPDPALSIMPVRCREPCGSQTSCDVLPPRHASEPCESDRHACKGSDPGRTSPRSNYALNMGVASLCLLFAATLLSASASATQTVRCVDDTKVCLLGVFPHSGSKQVASTFSTFAEDLSFELDVPVRLVSSSSMDKYRQRLSEGWFDIAVVGPGVFVAPGVADKYVPLVMVDRTLDIVVAVDAEGPIKKVSDLAGNVVGTLLRGSGTWLTQRSIMRQSGLDLKRQVTFREFRSAKDCVLALSFGQVVACGISEPILQAVEQAVPMTIRRLSQRQRIPAPVYLVHHQTGPRQRELVADYLMDRDGTKRYDPAVYASLRSAMEAELR